jgi:HlyD family secretion protein
MSVVRTNVRIYLIGSGIVALTAAGIVRHRMTEAALPPVRVESVERRDLSSVVMASGNILPKRSVHISADTVGRVTRLAVDEGERVRAGQFLLQIDPETLESVVQRGEAGLAAAREAVNSAKVAISAAQARYEMASQNRKRMEALFQEKLVSRETVDRMDEEIEVRESELHAREAEMRAAEQRLEQEIADLRGARHQLSKVTIESPMNGLITQLNIEEGETVLVGTMNNPGTVLMTIADLSVIQAELEVDESDVVDLRLGQRANVRIDALVGRSYRGQITKIGSSALRSANPFQTVTDPNPNFEVIVTLDDEVPDARPGFSCSAEIITNTIQGATAVPIQAVTSRRVDVASDEGFGAGKPPGAVGVEPHPTEFDQNGNGQAHPEDLGSDETEGVFVVRDGRAWFVPLKIGLAGERYFEVVAGLKEGDQVIVGPHSTVRELSHGARVRILTQEEPVPVSVP